MRIFITIPLILSLLIPVLLWSQSEAMINEILTSIPSGETHINSYKSDKSTYTSEYKLVVKGAFIFYKNFISSQDASHCSFTPSCSEYALIAIGKQGLVAGSLNFFDRFSRCNSLSPENYPKDPHNHLLIDPVRDIHYEKIP